MARFSGCRELEAGLNLRAPRFGCLEGRSGPYKVDHELRMTLYYVVKGISDLRQSLTEELNKSMALRDAQAAKEKEDEKRASLPAVVSGEKEKEVKRKKPSLRKKSRPGDAPASVAAAAAAFAQQVLSAEAALGERRASGVSLPYLKGLFERMGGTVVARMKKKKILTMQVTVRGHGLALSSKGRKADLKQQVQRFLQELGASR